MMPAGRDRIIFALDLPGRAQAELFCDRLGESVGFYKVGLELFCAEGPAALAALGRRGRLFLDLKLCDIPETCGRAVAALAGTGAELLTVHVSGGRAMLERAVAAARGTRLGILGVTVLTSLDGSDLAETGAVGDPAALALARARLAAEAGCAGVVCSPAEVAELRRALPPPFLLVVPGVRPAGAERGDQKRVAGPAEAVRAGADFLVIGRPIRDAADPAAAARAIAAEIDGG